MVGIPSFLNLELEEIVFPLNRDIILKNFFAFWNKYTFSMY